MTIIAAADGSALGNPGPAGWAWYIDDERWRCGGWSRGTNNQGELAAVLDLLRQTAHSDEPLHVLCDSQYVINSVTKWMAGWKRKGWKKADGKPVLNVEVMKALDEAMRGRQVTFEWVKGHAGHELNEKADVLANGAAKAHAARKEPKAGPGFPGARSVGAGDDPFVPPPAGGEGDVRKSTATATTTTTTTTSSGTADEPDLFSVDAHSSARPADSGPAAAPAGHAIEDLVVDLERSLLTDAVRGDRKKLTRLLDVRWRQVDSAGRVQTRRELGDAGGSMGGSSLEDVDLEVLETRRLGDDVVLVLWRASGSDGVSSLRSSIWQRTGSDWKQVYQQGTREA
ncbi:ribonuclease HI family protein [Rhodococcus sp. IEGM 1408]|uniref:ribonuclease HI family protein n=1 Tax=Rhodococcus sp. IEGM 1408 TaxID=3082220 RepID=UPI002953310B|nr:ribonuclease HI family protein [Rhodococcus sp. IEGM 1408]MDV8000928.1 ribonuclease HI family protein [Rhodococcus sp. IEGM 1408]